MNSKVQTLKYLLADFLSAALAWLAFFIFRKVNYDPYFNSWKEISIEDSNLFYGITLIPLGWVAFYFFLGSYKSVYRKSRVKEMGITLLSSIIGVSILFFLVVIDDFVHSYKELYEYALALFVLHFSITAFARLTLTTLMVRNIHSGAIGFRTIIIGGNGKATSTYLEIVNQFISSGNQFVGFLNVTNNKENKLSKYLPYLGSYTQVQQIIETERVEEVIIAIDPSEHDKIKEILTRLQYTKVIIKIIPDMYDIMLGSVKMTAIFQAPLIQIYPDILPHWQVVIKRGMDVLFSVLAIVFLSPLYIFTALGVYFTSKGPIFYSQVRIGLNGKPFKMLKFRTMYEDAEKGGPQLSSTYDPRITHFGRFMRKVRLDEIPQFFTVIKGDMSLVGYRPERQYFIDQIVEKAPHYNLLLKIKPGITSWGQVKYGYAENVDEMIERLRYDILYLENMSIAVDLKIMFYTLFIVVMGRGK